MSYYYKCYYGTAGTVTMDEDHVLWDNSVDGLGIINGTLSLVTSDLCHATVEMHGSHKNIDIVAVGTFVTICRVIDGTETPVFTGFISNIDEDIYGTKVSAYTDILALIDYCNAPNPSSGWNDIDTYITNVFNFFNTWNVLDFEYEIDKTIPGECYVWGDFSGKSVYGALQAIAENAEKYSYMKLGGNYYNNATFKFYNDPVNTRKIVCQLMIGKPQVYINSQGITLGDNIIDITTTHTFPDYTCIYATDSSGHTFDGDFGLTNYSSGKFGISTNLIKFDRRTYTASSGNDLYFYSKQDAQSDYFDIQTSYAVTAFDKSVVDGTVEPFAVNKAVHVVSEKHGIDSYAWISEYSIDLVKPSNSKVSLGGTQTRISK